jgi:hypothetical protein
VQPHLQRRADLQDDAVYERLFDLLRRRGDVRAELQRDGGMRGRSRLRDPGHPVAERLAGRMRYRGAVARPHAARPVVATALVSGAVVALAACSYDWTLGGAFRGVPGTDGGTSPSDGLDAGGRPGAKVCGQGEACGCPASASGTEGGACALDCPAGQCALDCTGAASCSLTCGGQCDVTCGDAGTCELLTCESGQCSMACPSSTSCTIRACALQCSCEGPGCR